MSFANLGLSDVLLQSIAAAGFETPTPIQERAIPYVLMNRDVLACAQTGTGKTASFALPMIEIMSHGRARARMPRSLIIEPTRELAAQVADQFEMFGKSQNLSMALLIGGVNFSEQERVLDRGADVLIATPGRLLDHFERGKVLLSDVKMLVLDESDRMLDMGFIPDIERIISLLPRMRQTLLFSATMPKEIRRLAEKFMHNPKDITVDAPATAAKTIRQSVLRVAPRDKRKVLLDLVKGSVVQNALVFCNRKRDVASLYRFLEKQDISVGALHGDMDQYSRLATLDKFKDGDTRILVCSDVAARGLDIPAMSHVFNYDVPHNAEDYIHRIGRTGRAGREGHSITLAGPEDERTLAQIKRLPGIEIEDLGATGSGVEAVVETVVEGPSEPAVSEGDAAQTAPAPRAARRRAPRADRERGGTERGKKGAAEKKDAHREEQQPAAAAAPASSPRPDPRREKRADARPRHRADEREDKTPVGLGDHVPAFLLREPLAQRS